MIVRVINYFQIGAVPGGNGLGEICREGDKAVQFIVLHILHCLVVVFQPDNFRLAGFERRRVLCHHCRDNLIADTAGRLIRGEANHQPGILAVCSGHDKIEQDDKKEREKDGKN